VLCREGDRHVCRAGRLHGALSRCARAVHACCTPCPAATGFSHRRGGLPVRQIRPCRPYEVVVGLEVWDVWDSLLHTGLSMIPAMADIALRPL
jgi:hypothetical protein